MFIAGLDSRASAVHKPQFSICVQKTSPKRLFVCLGKGFDIYLNFKIII